MRITFFISIILFAYPVLIAQTEYVPVDKRVYEFLERMETIQIIPDYNSFEVPKTRKEIAEYLTTVISNQQKLDETDKKYLNDLEVEFEFELYGTLKNSSSLLSRNYDFLSQNQKYLFYYNDSDKINLFVNLIGEGQLLLKNDLQMKTSPSAFLGIIGGDIRGTLLNKFGFYIHGTNGNVFGKKEAALLREDLQYNYKLNENQDETFLMRLRDI